MRIANLTIVRNYTTQLQSSQKRMYDSNLRVQTGRRFNTMSEDVALGLRAMKVRRDLDKNATWQDNVRECKSILKSTEDALYNGILPMTDTAPYEKYLMALNGTSGAEEYGAIKSEIEKLQEQLLSNLNSQFTGRYLFGGSQIGEAPFTVDVDGKLMYKNVRVEDITLGSNGDVMYRGLSIKDLSANSTDVLYKGIPLSSLNVGSSGEVEYNGVLIENFTDTTDPFYSQVKALADSGPPYDYDADRISELTALQASDPELVEGALKVAAMYDDPVYIDIGLGMTLDNNGNPLPSTVFDRSINGLDVVGIGRDNMYDILGRMIDSLTTGNLFPDFITKLQDAGGKARVVLTQIGANDSYLDFAKERLGLDEYNLIERQDTLEFVPAEEAILSFEMLKYAYNAALQMGNEILQPGLFNYLR